jgi:hypothetical protein
MAKRMTPETKLAIHAAAARGWSLRDNAEANGVSHESVRRELAKPPPVVTAPAPTTTTTPQPPPLSADIAARAAAMRSKFAESKRPGRAAQRRPARNKPPESFLVQCKRVLADLRRRARATPLPQLRARFSADATKLSGLILRLGAREVQRTDDITMTAAEAEQIAADLRQRFAARQAGRRLVCAGCGRELTVNFGDSERVPQAEAPAAAPRGDTHAALLAESREDLAFLLDGADEAELDGNEVASQKQGRHAVALAGFIDRLERELEQHGQSAKGAVTITAPEVADIRQRMQESFAVMRSRPLHCAECSRQHSIDLSGARKKLEEAPHGR